MLAVTMVDAPVFSAVTLGIGQGTNAVVQVHIWPTYFGRAHIGAIRGYIVPAIITAQALGAPFTGFLFDTAGTYRVAFWTAVVLIIVAGFLLASVAPPARRAVGS